MDMDMDMDMDNEVKKLTCRGCVDEFTPLHDELGIANCGICLRNETIQDYYHLKPDLFTEQQRGGL